MLKMTQTIHLFDNRRYPVNENADREQINSMVHNNTTITTNVISVIRSVWTGNKDYWNYNNNNNNSNLFLFDKALYLLVNQ